MEAMLLKNYMINNQTILLTGIYGRFSHLQTMVIEGNKTYRVNVSSDQLINSILRKRGSSLRKSMDKSREYLGNSKMYPIKIDPQQGIYFFPSKSPKRPDCVWFSLIHVKRAETFEKNKTKVFLSHGHSIIIDGQLSAFMNKWQKALELRRKMAESENFPIMFYLEQREDKSQKEVKMNPDMIFDDQIDLSSGQNEREER
jgi:competence protein ComK